MATTCKYCNSKLVLDSQSLLLCQNKDCDFKFNETETRKPQKNKIEYHSTKPKKEQKPTSTSPLWFLIGVIILFTLPVVFCDSSGGYHDPRSDGHRRGGS
jgi:hypothetical protein